MELSFVYLLCLPSAAHAHISTCQASPRYCENPKKPPTSKMSGTGQLLAVCLLLLNKERKDLNRRVPLERGHLPMFFSVPKGQSSLQSSSRSVPHTVPPSPPSPQNLSAKLKDTLQSAPRVSESQEQSRQKSQARLLSEAVGSKKDTFVQR